MVLVLITGRYDPSEQLGFLEQCYIIHQINSNYTTCLCLLLRLLYISSRSRGYSYFNNFTYGRKLAFEGQNLTGRYNTGDVYIEEYAI